MDQSRAVSGAPCRLGRTGAAVSAMLAAVGSIATFAGAEVTIFSGTHNPAPWFAAAGPDATTVTFDGYENGTVIADQYLDQGIAFTQPGYTAYQPGASSGGWLMTHNQLNAMNPIAPTDGVRATFATPMRAIALNHWSLTASMQITLYSAGQAFWTGAVGPNWSAGGVSNLWGFGGIVSDQAFDGVWITATQYQGYPTSAGTFLIIDTLHFSAVPAPSALAAFAPCLLGRRRRRTR